MHASELLMYIELCRRLISDRGVKMQATTLDCDAQCYDISVPLLFYSWYTTLRNLKYFSYIILL